MFSGQRKQEQEQESNSEDLGPSTSTTPEKLNRSFDRIDNKCPLLEIEREETKCSKTFGRHCLIFINKTERCNPQLCPNIG